MLPKASQLSTNASPPASSTSTSTRPKLGFSIDSLVGLSEAPKPTKTSKRHTSQHAKHIKHYSSNNNESIEAGSAELKPVLSDDLRNEYRGEFRTNLFNNEDVRDMQHQMENIQQALYHINRNKRTIQHLSSPSSSSPSPSPPNRKPHSPKHFSKKGFVSPRRKSPPPSPSILQRTLNNSGLHRPAFSPPVVSSPIPTRSPTLSSPVSSTGSSTLRIPEPIHPLNSSPIPISLSNTLTNHLSNPLSNPLNFPPFGLPLAALLPQIKPGYPHPSLAPSISSAQDFHGSMASNEATSLSNSSLPGLSSSSATAATSSGLPHSHINSNGLMTNPLIPNGLSSNAHSGLIQTALPASWGPTSSAGFNTGPLGPGSLGPSLIGPHGLGTPLPPANLPRQYPVYPWLLTRHNRLFGHRFPGPDFPTFLLPFRKPKRIRTAFSPSQLLKLEQAFEKNQYVVGQERKQLAQTLNLSETQVKVWFQNRRTKHKRVVHDGEDGEDGTQSTHDDDLDGESRYDEDEDRPGVESDSTRRRNDEERSPEPLRRTIVGDSIEEEDGEQRVDSSSIMDDEATEIGTRGMSPPVRSNDGLRRPMREEDRRSRSPMEVEQRRDSIENPDVRSDKQSDLGLPVSSMMMNPSKQNQSYFTSSILKNHSDNFMQEATDPVGTSPRLDQAKEHFSSQANGAVLLGSTAERTMAEHSSVNTTALGLTIQRMTHCSSGN